jgi:adenylate cyclase
VLALLRGSLFRKYFIALFVAAAFPVIANGASEAWYGYRDQRDLLNALLREQAAAAAEKIRTFLDSIRDQLSWTVQQPWTTGTEEQHRLDALRVLHQAPAIVSITLIDNVGLERLRVSRIELNRGTSGIDRTTDPAVSGARGEGIWYGPVTYVHDSEPFMTLSLAGNRQAVGVVVADINLKLIWDVVARIRVGHSGQAFVTDELGRLIAHPDISRVLRGTDDQAAASFRRLRDAITGAGGGAVVTSNTENGSVLATMGSIAGPNWTVFVEQPEAEAFAPIYAALWRIGGFLLAATIFAAALAYWLAGRMTGPIRLLEEGAQQVGAGEFEHRINITTGDELERLAASFNQMAEELVALRERTERVSRLKRFLSPQVAELVEKAGDEGVLAGQRAEVVAVFCDLRGFTAFSAQAEPEEVMRVLHDYYQSLGAVITRYEATLTNFSADGLMVLLNAPVTCPEPAMRAVEMAVEMQRDVQQLIGGWHERGHAIGFGMGLAIGWATVGRIGYQSRQDYTAIGNVVNLASRLCSSADDRQILVDVAVFQAVRGRVRLNALGGRRLKGYDRELPVYDVEWLNDSSDQGARPHPS